MLNPGLAVAFGAMLSFALSDFLAKKASARIGSKRATLVMLFASLGTMLVAAAFIGLSAVNSAVVLFAVLSGIVYVLAELLLYKSLETEQVSNTLSLAGIEYGMITIFSVLVLGEVVTGIEIASFVLIFAGAFLATTSKKFEFNRGYIPAILGMVAFAAAYVLLLFSEQSSGGIFVTLVINRIVAVSAMSVYLWLSPEKDKRFRGVKLAGMGYGLLAVNLLMGVFNASGGITLLLLAPLNFVAVGSAIVAIEPAVVILLGYLFYKERFSPHQVIGFVLLVAGTIALSVA